MEGRSSDQYLSTDRVRHIYSECFRGEQCRDPMKFAKVEAWMLAHTFAIRDLQRFREDIIRMLLSLPEGFRGDERGGGSVAMMIKRGDGTMWTDDMSDIEKLVSLGVAVGLMSFCAPRERWKRLPGGLPYVRIEITRFGVSVN